MPSSENCVSRSSSDSAHASRRAARRPRRIFLERRGNDVRCSNPARPSRPCRRRRRTAAGAPSSCRSRSGRGRRRGPSLPVERAPRKVRRNKGRFTIEVEVKRLGPVPRRSPWSRRATASAARRRRRPPLDGLGGDVVGVRISRTRSVLRVPCRSAGGGVFQLCSSGSRSSRTPR